MVIPELPFPLRTALAVSGGVVVAMTFIFVSPWWLGVALPSIAILLLLLSVNWKTPLTATVVTALSFWLAGLAIASLPVAADKTLALGLIVLVVWLLSLVISPVVWAVTGYTFASTPRHRWIIASGSAFVLCALTLTAVASLMTFAR